MNQKREGTKPELVFENLWKKKDPAWQEKVKLLWKKHFPETPEAVLSERVKQVVFVICTSDGNVVGISTAYKSFIMHLKHNFYAFRCFIDAEYRVPGLTSTLLVKTRDFLEEIHQTDGAENERCIGVITLVENERIMKHRNEAIWSASQMVYIGNSPKGYHIRVYYFRRVLI